MGPFAQQLILNGIDIAGRKWIENGKRTPTNNEITKQTMERLENFQKEVDDIKKSTKNIEKIKEKEQKDRGKTVINPEKNNYSNYAPDMNVATGCITCSRAHILGIRGSLKEALRFAREDGVNHPEVEKRVDNAAEELIVMERFDLSPEQIEKSPPEEKEIIKTTLPKIRELRQYLVNKIDDTKDLEEATVLANSIYKEIRKKSTGKGEDEIA